jgi:hypothetical protein
LFAVTPICCHVPPSQAGAFQAAKQSVDDSPEALEIAPRSSYVPALPIGA